MYRVPKEVIYRHAFQEIGEYFAKKATEERQNGKVAILVKDFIDSIYYFPCDERGAPEYWQQKYATISNLEAIMCADASDAFAMQSVTMEEKTIQVERPILSSMFDEMYPTVFLWSGRVVSRKQIPLEKLNVKELMKLAQNVITTREGLVIDEAFKNKIYK